MVEPVYARDGLHRLVDFNVALIRAVVERLGIATRLVLASELALTGSSTRLMIEPDPGGRRRRVPVRPDRARRTWSRSCSTAPGVALRYHEFAPFEYPQLHGEFVPAA